MKSLAWFKQWPRWVSTLRTELQYHSSKDREKALQGLLGMLSFNLTHVWKSYTVVALLLLMMVGEEEQHGRVGLSTSVLSLLPKPQVFAAPNYVRPCAISKQQGKGRCVCVGWARVFANREQLSKVWRRHRLLNTTSLQAVNITETWEGSVSGGNFSCVPLRSTWHSEY